MSGKYLPATFMLAGYVSERGDMLMSAHTVFGAYMCLTESAHERDRHCGICVLCYCATMFKFDMRLQVHLIQNGGHYCEDCCELSVVCDRDLSLKIQRLVLCYCQHNAFRSCLQIIIYIE